MIGKKKSGFQITSVTSDYDGGSGEGLKETTNGEAELGGTSAAPLVNGEPGYGAGGQPPAPAPNRTPPSSVAEAASGPAGGEGVSRDARAGPLDLPAAQEASVPADAPAGTKSPLKAACPPGSGGHHSCSSRFRVVKLDHGLGEPYRRGRWTCLDLYDKDLDGHALAKVLDGAGRHVNSLDSHLELSSFTHKAVNQLRPKLHAPKSQGSPPLPYQGDTPRGKPVAPGNTLNMLLQAAKTLSLAGPAGTDHPRQHGPQAPASPPRHSAQVPAGRGHAGTASSVPSVSVTVMPKETVVSKSDSSVLTVTSKSASKQQLPTVSQPSGEQGGLRKFSEPRSAPASPGPLAQDGSPSRKASTASSLRFVSPMQTLAKSMLSVGTQQDGDDDSGSSSSMVAIDNKIEQAMDLVKSHLMYAVREEVEVLKEQIKELMDRNTLLERENALLKSLANPDQLSQLQAQMRSAGSSGGSSGSSPASTSVA